MRPAISIFASAVRPHLWPELFESLRKNKCAFEVVFAGPLTGNQITEACSEIPEWFKYIQTSNIKPAQCYEIARRYCTGELVQWTADDCEYSPNLLDDLYDYWNLLNNIKAVVSIKTNENEENNLLDDQRFFSGNKNTPLMAPLGLVNNTWLSALGGFDRRYICGQYENDFVMRSNMFGGKVYKFESGCVDIKHKKKHGNTTKFWHWFDHDRQILETSWVVDGYHAKQGLAFYLKSKVAFYPIHNYEVSLTQLDKFEPYEDTDILTKSQSFKGEWE